MNHDYYNQRIKNRKDKTLRFRRLLTTSRPLRRNNLIGQPCYERQKLYVCQPLDRLSVGRPPGQSVQRVGRTPDDVCLLTGTDNSRLRQNVNALQSPGIPRTKGCSVRQDFCVSTRFYCRRIRVNERAVPIFSRLILINFFFTFQIRSNRQDRIGK